MGKSKRGWEQGGFSLIELMIVMGVVATLAVTSGASLLQTTPKTQLHNAAKTIALDLIQARQTAITNNRDAGILFDLSSSSYTFWTDRNRNGTVEAGETTLRDMSLTYYDVSLELDSSTQNPVFNPRGGTLNGVSRIWVRSGTDQHAVEVALTGNVRVQK